MLNYIGPQDVGGIRMFYSGVEVANDTITEPRNSSSGDGRIVVGRYKTDDDNNYPSVQVDELMFFDSALSRHQIQKIYTSV